MFKADCSLLMYADLSRYLVAAVQALILQSNLMLQASTTKLQGAKHRGIWPTKYSSWFHWGFFLNHVLTDHYSLKLIKNIYLFGWQLFLHAGLERDELFLHSNALRDKEIQFNLTRRKSHYAPLGGGETSQLMSHGFVCLLCSRLPPQSTEKAGGHVSSVTFTKMY